METLILEVERREGTGKGPARRARAAGRIPGVLYGGGRASVPVAMDARQVLRQIARREGTYLLELRSADEDLNGRRVLVRELQVDPVTSAPLHLDLYEVPLDKAIEVRVPLHFVGKAAGVTMGGVLQPLLREIAVRCLPTAIPEAISVSVEALQIHDSIHVSDLALPEGAQPIPDPAEPVVTVLAPVVEKRAEEEGEAEAGAEAGAAAEAPASGGESAAAGS